ncbi:MarR family winged helix-turn-helix transcriptional regulator [Polymorphum gilvum]|uniref:Transcriptional regulator, MarR family n=1 Tax=Polymorphum gilvum (strain LMG 25793 / CGMCC 1.9160 / SL003B-26A1) TaxID=991905 RepID=F2J6B7_POLGS|nr:MarR family transcriptional regulator [Polymorphum gilvum]ADZ71290.1 Transcriptional regulator, MarR family [Polymorphum gilvum SL003B-26A1]
MDQTIAPPLTADKVEMGQLEVSLGFLLRVSQLRVFEYFYKEIGHLGLKPGEFSVLWLIYCNPGIRQGILAQRLMIKNAHMTKLVRAFESDGYIMRTIPDHDRRAVELDLTPMGREFVARHRSDFFGYIGSLDSHLSADEKNELIRLLRKFSGLDREETK